MIHSESFIHDKSIVGKRVSVGARTRIWAFTNLLDGAEIGEDCNVCDHVFIEGDVKVGDRVTIKCGVQLWNGLRIEDDVFIGPNVTFTNDLYPRSKQYPEHFLNTYVKAGASIGGGAIILPGITVGAKAIVGAGSVVTKSVPAKSIVAGNPARLIRMIE